jgi:O-methyltransferase domain
MSDTVTARADAAPPEAQIAQILLGQLVPRLAFLFATLKLADHLSMGAKSAEQLGSLTGTHAPTLARVLRTLASLGFVTEDAQHRFALQPLGAVLKSGTPSYAAALILGGEIVTRSLEHFVHSVQTGKTGFERAFGKPAFDWLGEHPAEASLFNHTMVGFHGMEPAAVAAAYDFSKMKTVADVGGSTGNMIATILSRYPETRGILFDLPHVVAEAPPFLEQRGVADRVRIEGGSFFDRVPAGADAYVLSHVIHDWNEEQCLTILGHCRRAMSASSRLLLVEMVLPEGDTPHPGKLLDMLMLSVPGGEERTPSQYAALLDRAGFKMTQVVPTQSLVGIVEGVPK